MNGVQAILTWPAEATTAVPTGSPMPEASVDAPESCVLRQSGRSPYFNLSGGYCLLYPSYFSLGENFAEDMARLTGPVYFNAPDVQIVLSIEVDEPVAGRSLDELVDEATGNQDNVTRTEAMLGGQAALIVSGPENELGQPARHLYAIRDNTVYRLTLVPANSQIPSQAGEDLEAVWNRVLDSFTFVSPQLGRPSQLRLR